MLVINLSVVSTSDFHSKLCNMMNVYGFCYLFEMGFEKLCRAIMSIETKLRMNVVNY